MHRPLLAFLHGILPCALDERCCAAQDLLAQLGSQGPDLIKWSAEHLAASLMGEGDDLARFIGKICSFAEDTLVATDEGAVPIREVDIGDRVLAWGGAAASLIL